MLLISKFQGIFAKKTAEASEPFTVKEHARATELAQAFDRLLLDEDNQLDLLSEHGAKRCEATLELIDALSDDLRVEVTPRSYRKDFNVNYRVMFRNYSSRLYRVDIFDAAMARDDTIYVNGDEYRFSAEVLHRASLLENSWSRLRVCLRRLGVAGAHSGPLRGELRLQLCAFDQTWVNFEQLYISELIAIEDQARGAVTEAVKAEAHLRTAEHCRSARQRFVSCISQLNTMGNVHGKGRGDLGVEILEASLEALAHCEEEEVRSASVVRVLAGDVANSYTKVRKYCSAMEARIQHVDPQLSSNQLLLAALVEWEESWAIGAQYVLRPGVLSATCSLVAEVRAVQGVAPGLSTLIENADAEFFLVLPRILWFCFLLQPAQHTELLRMLLPSQFSAATGCPGAELNRFVALFEQTAALLTQASGSLLASRTTIRWNALAKLALNGPSGVADLGNTVARGLGGFMGELERWSMELQRHCPEDWNRCTGIILRCMAST